MNIEPPNMEQLTAISGKNMPNLLYSEGLNLSITISTNCTAAAIVAINAIKVKNDKLTSEKAEIPVHERAPGSKR